MSRTTKIVLAVVAGVVLVCACIAIGGVIVLNRLGRAAGTSIGSDPTAVGDVSSSIADFTLPSGFTPEVSFRLLGMSMVGYTRQSDDHFILLMQLPAGANMEPAEMQRQLREAMGRQGVGRFGTDMKVVDEYPATVRGQNVTATVSEGKDDQGGTLRQLTAAFQGKGGVAIVMILGPADRWDQSGVDAFLASMR